MEGSRLPQASPRQVPAEEDPSAHQPIYEESPYQVHSTPLSKAKELNTTTTGMGAEDFATAIATAIAAGLRGVMQPNTTSPSLCYTGQDIEDPIVFLQRMDRHLAQRQIPDEDKIYVVADHLKGEAARWARNVVCYQVNYTGFKRRLLQRFNSPQIVANLKAKLYGDRQQEQEAVTNFIARKTGLFARLEPQLLEEDRAAQILELIDPRICSHLRTAYIPDTYELSRLAEQIEGDHRRCRRPPQPAPRTSIAGTTNQGIYRPPPRQPPAHSNQRPSRNLPGPSTAERPLSRPCRWCQGEHYDSQCSQNAYVRQEGNRPRAETDARTPRPAPLPRSDAPSEMRQ